MDHDEAEDEALEATPVVDLVPQKHGGALRRGGNPGNRGSGTAAQRRRHELARDLLEARTPQFARLLIRAATQMKNAKGKDMTNADWLRALTAALDRGKVAGASREEPIATDPLRVSVVAADRETPPALPAAEPLAAARDGDASASRGQR